MDKNITIEDPMKFSNMFLDEYLENGLGVKSKREIDILVMHLLTEYCSLGKKSNHELSIQLQSTESRIKSLRYESKLRYPPEDTKYIEKGLLEVLTRAQFDVEKKKVIFVIEDSYLRFGIQGRLKEKGMFADNSFNTELVKIDSDSLESLLREMFEDEVADQFKSNYNEMIKSSERENEKQEIFRKLKIDLVTSAVNALGGAAAAGFLEYLKTIILRGV